MNFLETEYQKYRRRVEKINANPDPTKLKSNAMLYQLSLEQSEQRWKWYQEGRPFAYTDGMTGSSELLLALGMQPLSVASDADRTGNTAPRFLNLGKQFRYHESLCDRVLAGQGLTVSGDYPPPSFIGACNYPCTAHTLAMVSIGKHFNVPMVAVDLPHEYTAETIAYVVEQLEDLIAVAEAQVPGVRYDEERLAADQEAARAGRKILVEIQDLRANIPSPVSGVDVLRIPRFFYHDPKACLAYLETYLAEMHERVAKRIVAVPNEKLRLMWTISAPLFTENIWNFLHSHDTSVIYFEDGRVTTFGEAALEEMGYPPLTKLLGRTPTPLEVCAGDMAQHVWSGPVERRLQLARYVMKNYHCDGIVQFQQSGCPQGQSTAQTISETLEAELGVPSLLLDGRMLDQEWYNEAQVFSQLEEFVDLCLAYKQARKTRT